MRRFRNRLLVIAGVAALGSIGSLVGCVHRSGGTWMVSSAALPEGWPDLTPVGEVQIREYPAYRAATVREVDLERGGMSPMFMELFDHISRNDIAMTAPVDMGYVESGSERRMSEMAFLYRDQEIGEVGAEGAVVVEDHPPATYASVGVRGGYNDRSFERGLGLIESWLAVSSEWRASGPPRFLGYNSPFVPVFLRYGEVQVPVRSAAAE